MSRFLALALLAACNGEGSDDTGQQQLPAPGELVASDLSRNMHPDVSDATLRQLTSDNRAFALDLLPGLSDGTDNLFVSPHSISIALAMTYAGAEGTTETQMADVLHYALPESELHPAFNALDLELASRNELGREYEDGEGFRLSIVNQLFGQVGYPFQEPFLDTLAVNYGAGLRLLDFAADPDGQRALINDWVEDSTEGRIEDLLPQGSITTYTKLVLANAIYFKASWEAPFEASMTTDDPFNLLGGGTASVPTMHGWFEGGYARGDGFEVVDIPYVGQQLSMTVVMPDEGRFSEIQAYMDGETLGAAIAGLGTYAVTCSLPKFGFTSDFDLVAPLATMGMTDAFDPMKADFSGMSTASDLYITGIFHQAFVAVDEVGTEAAAATAVVVGDTSAPEPVSVVIDRPFLFLVRDRPTGAVLFLGRVTDPSQE